VAYEFYAQQRFPLEERLTFVRTVIEHERDIGVVHHAFRFLDNDAKIFKTVLGFRDHLHWIDDQLIFLEWVESKFQ
jgi:hypothetical protein